MKTNKINFGSWHILPQSQIRKLSPEETFRLGIDLAKCKSQKKICQNYMGIYIDIMKKKENKFMELCDKYDIMPQKTKLN